MSTQGRRGCAIALLVLVVALFAPALAAGHGAASEAYDARIDSIEPEGLPIDVRVVEGDQLRIENVGDEELVLCGYKGDAPGGCEQYVRLGPDGVFVDENTNSYYANLDEEQYGDVPDDVGAGGPDWKRVRREPIFYKYHDHRIHWMGSDDTLPPGVDDSDPAEQLVNDFTVDMRYGDTPVQVTGRLLYVGGQRWYERYGELLLTGLAVLVMLVVFVLDARRRRRAKRGPDDGDDGGSDGDGADTRRAPRTRGTTTILEPETEDVRT